MPCTSFVIYKSVQNECYSLGEVEMPAQVAARHELICVHFKAKAGSISLCKDVEVQLSPEIRVAINTQNP